MEHPHQHHHQVHQVHQVHHEPDPSVVEQVAKKPRLSANESLPTNELQHGETTEIIMQDNSQNTMVGVEAMHSLGFFDALQDDRTARYSNIIQSLPATENRALKYLVANLLHRPKKRYIIIPKEYRYPQRTKSVVGYGADLDRLDWTNQENAKGGHYHKWRASPSWDQNTFFRIIESVGTEYVKSLVDYATLEKEFTDTPVKPRKERKHDEEEDELEPVHNAAELTGIELAPNIYGAIQANKDIDHILKEALAQEIDKREKEIAMRYKLREQDLVKKYTSTDKPRDRVILLRTILEDICEYEENNPQLIEEVVDEFPKDFRKFKAFIIKLNNKIEKSGYNEV